MSTKRRSRGRSGDGSDAGASSGSGLDLLTAALNQMVDSSPSKSSSSRKRKSAGGSNGHAGGRASFGGNGAASASSHSNGSGGGKSSAAAPRRRSAPKRPLSQSAPPPPPPPPAPPLSRAASASGLFVPKVTFPNYSFSDRSVDALPAASIAPMCARLRQRVPACPRAPRCVRLTLVRTLAAGADHDEWRGRRSADSRRDAFAGAVGSDVGPRWPGAAPSSAHVSAFSRWEARVEWKRADTTAASEPWQDDIHR